VLDGPLDAPRLTGKLKADDPLVNQLRLLVTMAQDPGPRDARLRVTTLPGNADNLDRSRMLTAQLAQMLLFFLTILLSGMLLSQLVEEKSNKIIEVIAAAAPIDSLFLGKLFAMLAASVVGIVVWVGSGALLVGTLKSGGLGSLPPPAVGWPAFLVLGIAYFAMNYLLLGSVFLTIGAQASTVREVQTLSMPVTFFQVLIFGVAASAIGAPDSFRALAAAIFPLSSPLVMLARAAETSGLAIHAFALAWQALWVALILNIGARLFRKTVLKSGPARPWWKRGARA
jgi:ABC-2 type transport system permease protein